tara:strand:+ start:344 stop:511 length:168 start_codon:yes stop_codon:yes gene_type:complete
MSTYTVKVTESYWFYDVEADSRQAAKDQSHTFIWDQHGAGDYTLSIEAEEEDEFN